MSGNPTESARRLAGRLKHASERAGHLEHAHGLIGGMLDDLDGYGMARWANEIRALRRRARDAADTARTAWDEV